MSSHFSWSYRLQNAAFVLRRYLPAPLRQFLKPLYRRWWRAASQKKLSEALAAKGDGLAAPSAGYTIICYSVVDWEFRIQRPQQLLSRLAAQGHRVFYLRTDFQPGSAPAPTEALAPNVYGLRLPGPAPLNIYEAAPPTACLNLWLQSLDSLRLAENLGEVVAFVESPFWTDLALAARERWGWKVIYDCLDDQSGFSVTPAAVLALEHKLVRESDLMLTSGRSLYEKWAAEARWCEILPNAADYAHFQTPAISGVLAGLPGPIIGYIGALAEWFEPDWIREAARRHPDWQLVLIGLNSGARLQALEHMPNVHLLGEQPYDRLPGYLQRFDVAVIPFKLNALTRAANPVKFFEYLSAGKPVVATALPDLEPYQDVFYAVSSADEFVQQTETALAENTAEREAARLAVARANKWEARLATLAACVQSLYARVSIIIVSYRNLDYLKLCLEGIWAKTDWPNYEVIVVDNGSGADVVAYLEACQHTQPRLRVIYNAGNTGFAFANNQGLVLAQASDYVVLLNNDTVVTAGWLSGLIRHLAGDPSLGMVGPVTGWASNEARIPISYEASLAGLESFASTNTRAHAHEIRDVRTLDMFCVALRRDVVEKIGPLDEGFGLGTFEDDDYARRFRQAGYRLGCARDVFVHHWGWASFGQMEQAEYDRLFEANRRRFEEKWGERWQRPPLNLG